MKFDKQIDTTIVRALTKTSIHYLGLLKAVCGSYRPISRDAFNSHIKKLLSDGYIDKNDTGKRGKKVYYFLTEKTKQMQRLKVLNFKSKKKTAELNDQSEEEKRLNAYLSIFFISEHITYEFKTKEQLENFLSKARVSMNDLVSRGKPSIEHRADGKPYVQTVLTTGHSRIFVTEWKEMAANNNIIYSCSLPGHSPSEILVESERVFAHANITQAEMEDALRIAKREGMLKIVMIFGKESRYEIADQSVVNFIGACWDLLELILEKLQIVWTTIRGPNNQEIKWLELIKGRTDADAIRNQTYQQRHSLDKSKRKSLVVSTKNKIADLEEEIQESINILTIIHTATINKYRFPTERILEIVAPKALQKSNL
jgi:DNA-binding HxlR family transcriptional regulator